MKFGKKLMSGLLAGAVLAGSMLGTTGTVMAEETAIDTSKEVELVMYLIGSEPTAFADMMEVFNEKLKEDINATLKVKWIGWSDWKNQYPLILSSGESIDLIYAATWLSYYQQAQKGAFMPLEDLLPVYAPGAWEQTGEEARYQATLDGHMYCLPTGLSTYSSYGAIVRGDLMEKYGIEDIETYEDYAKYMEAIAENEPGMQPSGQYSAETLFDNVYFLSKGLYNLTSEGTYWIDPSEEHPTVFEIDEWEGFPEYLELMNEWYEKGFWPASALSNQDDKMFETGKAASRLHNVDTWAKEYTKNQDWDIRYYDLVGQINVLSYVQDSMAVPITSKNPERALMLLDLLRTDQEYFDLITYGVEGVNCEIQEDGSVKMLNSDTFGYDPCSWGFRTDELYRRNAELPAVYDDYIADIRENVVPNMYRSFHVDTDPIKSEYAAVQNIMAQYYDPLVLGYTDAESGREELHKQLTAAGSEKIKAELQEQLDRFIEERANS